MTLVYDHANERVVDIETGNTFEYGSDGYVICNFGNSSLVIGKDTSAALWAWLVSTSVRFEPVEGKAQ